MKRLAIAVGCLLLLLVAAALWVAQSVWLREQIRSGLIAQAEKATGGRVELGAFRLDWRTLTAECDGFVIHGTEPATEPPLLTVDRLIVGLKVISLLRRDVSLERIEAVRPRAHLIVYPGGGTNLPQPKVKPKGSLPETVLDLKIARFDLRDGFVLLNSEAPRPWSAEGRDLAAHVTYEAARARYAGDIAIAPLRVLGTDWQVSATAAMEQNRVLIPHAVLKSAGSEIDLDDAALADFNAPVVTARYAARVSLAEAATLLQLKTRQAGSVTTAGEARYVSLADYRVAGTAGGAGIDFDRLHNIRATADFVAVPGKMSFTNIRAGVLGGAVTAVAEVRDFNTFHASGHLAHFDLRQVAALDTSKPLPYDGVVSGPFEATGQIHDMSRPLVTVSAQATIAPAATGAPVHGEVALHYDAVAKRIDLGHSWVDLPNTHLEVAGTLGERLDVKLQSRDFAELAPAVDVVAAGRPLPPLKYESLDFDGSVTGPLTTPLIAGKASAKNLDYKGTSVESLAGDFTASASHATVSGGSIVAAGIHARGAGSLGLFDWDATAASPVTATAEVADAGLPGILKLAGHAEIDLKGTVNGSAQITGTLGDPHGNGNLSVANGSIYEQPFDTITAQAQFLDRNTQALTGLFVSGPKRVNISARFEHAGTRFPAGKLAFNLTSNTMPLNQIALVRQRQPDIHGFGAFHADGELQLSHDAQHNLQFDLLSLNATASANSLELVGRNLGDARASAQTRDGVLMARFDSNAAQASIHGEGAMGLTGDYPVNGKLTFTNAGLNALAALIVTETEAANLNFDGSAEGSVTVTGPARKPDQLSATLEVDKLQVHPLPNTDFARSLPNFTAANSGPVRAVLTTKVIRIENAHFTAPQTDVSVDGSVALTGQAPLNLRAQGTVNLALARTVSPDIASTGSVTLNATVRGDWKTPDFSGRASIRNADFHVADLSNGLTNANGDFVFSGTHATIQSFTAESGGGKVDAGGFVALTNGILAFRIEARAHEVRVRYPEGVSSISDATLTLAGSSERSEASGVVTIHRIAINPRLDIANVLASTGGPFRAPAGRAGLLSNLNLDVQISTAPDAQFETSVTQSLQADANLRLRGTATNPALIGRINITQGELIFFGNKYSINDGTVSFFDPVRIDPVLNIDLETKARGVDVTLTIAGSATRPLNVTFRSDPPLQYSDILALLATGRTPSDPTLAVRDTGQGQNFQQLGASTLIGQALANPAASRLQRFFGVSRLKIDPQLTGVTGSPEARLTIEQQITPDILFTYITDVSSTSTQLFRAEWSFNPRWSAILIRDENGYVGLDFAYKKRFK